MSMIIINTHSIWLYGSDYQWLYGSDYLSRTTRAKKTPKQYLAVDAGCRKEGGCEMCL